MRIGCWACVCTAICASLGCSLEQYRAEADRDAYDRIAEKQNDPRWNSPDVDIEIDPRSRYFEPYDQVHPPMPEDDPASHAYMHCVNCMKGWPCWHCNGSRDGLENPDWREQIGTYTEVTPDNEVVLSIDSALKLTYIHSPDYQDQLETLYLSALDVTTERFRLDTQFFGGNTTSYTHLGRLRPGGELNILQTDSDLRLTRRFATAGELLVGFANSFVWQFAGPDTNSTFSILNFSLLQPLLRGAGRDRALETLTRAERGLLANVRQLERFRHGVYTNVAIGNAGAGRVSRLGGFQGGTGLTGFSGTGQGGLGGVGAATGFGGGFFGGAGAAGGAGGGAGLAGGGAGQVGGFIGLLQSLQEIRNTQYSLDLQLRTLALLEANLETGTIDLTQVDQFRQNIETLRAQMLQARVGLQNSLETFKINTLGLPPDLPVQLEDDFIAQFQLIDPDVTFLQETIVSFQDELGLLPPQPNAEQLDEPFAAAAELLSRARVLVSKTEVDLEKLDQAVDTRKRSMEQTEQKLFDRDLQQLRKDFQKLPVAVSELENELKDLVVVDDTNAPQVLRTLVGWTRRLSDEVQSLSLVQARARLEAVVIEPVDITSDTAIDVARANRLDYMNNRAALVDSWRLIAFNADQLQSVLDVEFSGDLRTQGDNPVEFRGPNGSLRASVEFDAPITRLLERNNYRQALVDYQQSRRRLIQFDDGLHQDMRAQLRNLEQLKTNLEIQRRAVIISIRRVDFTRSELNRPLPTPEPGAAQNTFGPTAVQNLLSALSDLSNAQNNFMSVWLNYYSGRLQLVRDLGIMQLDENGRWIDMPIEDAISLVMSVDCEDTDLPPVLPEQWWELSEPPVPNDFSVDGAGPDEVFNPMANGQPADSERIFEGEGPVTPPEPMPLTN